MFDAILMFSVSLFSMMYFESIEHYPSIDVEAVSLVVGSMDLVSFGRRNAEFQREREAFLRWVRKEYHLLNLRQRLKSLEVHKRRYTKLMDRFSDYDICTIRTLRRSGILSPLLPSGFRECGIVCVQSLTKEAVSKVPESLEKISVHSCVVLSSESILRTSTLVQDLSDLCSSSVVLSKSFKIEQPYGSRYSKVGVPLYVLWFDAPHVVPQITHRSGCCYVAIANCETQRIDYDVLRTPLPGRPSKHSRLTRQHHASSICRKIDGILGLIDELVPF